MATPAWIRYANQSATRNKPLSPKLVQALSFLPELGVTVEVFSGGQDAKGHGKNRTGSVRHDHGNAGDVYFYKDGKRLDWGKNSDRPLFAEIVRQAKQRGVTGIGAGEGYMRPGSMHIGFGKPAVWGKGGHGSNAPDWLRQAYAGKGPAYTATDPIQTAALPYARPTTPQDVARDAQKWPIREEPGSRWKDAIQSSSPNALAARTPGEMRSGLGPIIQQDQGGTAGLGPVIITTSAPNNTLVPRPQQTNALRAEEPLPAHTLAALERYRRNPGPAPLAGGVYGGDRPGNIFAQGW